jgi:hypothetical protein
MVGFMTRRYSIPTPARIRGANATARVRFTPGTLAFLPSAR